MARQVVRRPHFGVEVKDRRERRRYTDARAEPYARRALMPRADFLRRLELPDHRLAEAFNVPLEQMVLRRAELASTPA
jgi:Zn-dependent peptidase ImmA (M78 family)